jgi:hypothetical protein
LNKGLDRQASSRLDTGVFLKGLNLAIEDYKLTFLIV